MDKQQVKKSKDTKAESVSELSEKVDRAKTIAFVDYHGLTVNQVSLLRDKIKETGGEMIVAKNTLVKRALLLNNLPDSGVQLQGPTATVFSYEDEIAPIKTLFENAKTSGLPKFKFGFFGQDFLDAAGLEKLAKIPNRETLQSQTVGLLASPIRGIVNVLNANLRNLAVVLSEIAKKQTI